MTAVEITNWRGATPYRLGCPYCPAGGAAIDDRRPPLAPLSNSSISGVTR